MSSDFIVKTLEEAFKLVGAYYDFDRKKFLKSSELINASEKNQLYGARNFVYLYIEIKLKELGLNEQGLKNINIHRILCGLNSVRIGSFNNNIYEGFVKQNTRYINEILKDSL